MTTEIISIIYHEKDWQETASLLSETGLKTTFVDRGGVGSLAKAYNEGVGRIVESGTNPDYVWLVSNIYLGEPDIHEYLIAALGRLDRSFVAIHPCFASDHEFCRCNGEGEASEVPYIEFTAPLIRFEVLKQFPLNESMPYWGHDLDWGYRVRMNGHKIAVANRISVGHVYIRNAKKEKVTMDRLNLRRKTDVKTRTELIRLYGQNWREVLNYKG